MFATSSVLDNLKKWIMVVAGMCWSLAFSSSFSCCWNLLFWFCCVLVLWYCFLELQSFKQKVVQTKRAQTNNTGHEFMHVTTSRALNSNILKAPFLIYCPKNNSWSTQSRKSAKAGPWTKKTHELKAQPKLNKPAVKINNVGLTPTVQHIFQDNTKCMSKKSLFARK